MQAAGVRSKARQCLYLSLIRIIIRMSRALQATLGGLVPARLSCFISLALVVMAIALSSSR